MLQFPEVIITVAGCLSPLFSMWVFFSLSAEKVYLAKRYSLLFFLLPGLLLLLVPLLHVPLIVFLGLGLVLGVLLSIILPPKINNRRGSARPVAGFDEREIMFSRRLLLKGTPEYEAYYREHPEHKKPDDTFRANPGLLQPETFFYDPVTFSAAEVLFDTVKTLSVDITGSISDNKVEVYPAAITGLLKSWAKKMGAVSSGITLMQPYHYYTMGGRAYNYGEKITPEHKYGFVFTVEMAEEMIGTGPLGPAVMESASQYLEAGKIAVVIAQYLRKLGYGARAHIDGFYQVICPLVARDAGLGEIGRMGLLMTPALGPRVRIGVVTTDIPLVADRPVCDDTIHEFCTRCKKCAVNCPAKAIPFDDAQPVKGVIRWQVNQEHCYTYWTKAGTDCGRCVAVCPYAHKDTLFHRMIRLGVKHSWLVNKLALPLDDLFYGKQPQKYPLPRWISKAAHKKMN